MDDDCELLFFDTFSHESCEELNLDLVQFPRPVYIFEIRVIPLGARVQADFPGGHRLGATNPSSFQLEFFVNDLSKRSACTFEQLGSLQYKQNVEIQFPVANKIPTDGLVLRGLYSAVTLAVYGILTKTSAKERSSPPPPPPPQSVTRSQAQDHRAAERPVIDQTIPPDWERHSRPVEVNPEPQPAIHPHSQAMVEGPRFAEVPPIIHPQTEPHMQYAAEIPQPVYPEPPPSIVYPECIPATVPSVPAPAPYQQYDTRYQKAWPPPLEEHYPAQSESYDPQVYRQPDPAAYPPATSVPHSVWDPKECHPPEMPRQDRDIYEQSLHEHNIHSRSKERRDKPWERDCNVSDYKDDDLSRERDYKRKERDHRSWERGSSDSERYRDRMKESSSRDRDKDRDRERCRDMGREKPRSHDGYSERSSRTSVKRPVTPPTPPSVVHSRAPQTPPDLDKMVGGPRTPKEEEPSESFDDRADMDGSHNNDYYEMLSPERRVNEPMYNLSEGEIQEGDNTEDDDGYEEIVSEEEIMSDGEDRVLDMADIEYGLGDETWNYMSSFSPYHCELTTCQFLPNPTLSEFEKLAGKTEVAHVPNESDPPKENKILDMINSFQAKEHTDKWIEALESLNSSIIAEGLLAIGSKQTYDDAINTFVDWVVEGLDFDLALQQPQTAYKVRHMKAGIRLASLLFRTNADIIGRLLAREVPRLLLQLFDQPYVVLPVKLLILRALDSVTYTEDGLNFLLKKQVEFEPPKDFDSELSQIGNQTCSDKKCGITETGYQKLLGLLLSKQLTRVMVSISALLEKIHLFEVLHKLQEATESLVQNIQTIEQKTSTAEDVSNSMEVQTSTVQVEAEITEQPADPVNSSSWEENINIIITCLTDVTVAYRNAWRKLAQPKRLLPSRNLLEFPKSPFDPYPGVLRMFKENSLLENILCLLSSPMLINHTGIVMAVRELLLELLQSQNGKLFLLSVPDTTNSIQKALLQNVDEGRDENTDENITSNLGMQIVYRLQALLYVDSLLGYHSRGGPKKELDDHDAVSALHHMYTMIFSPVGRLAVVDILSSDNNLSALLPFVQMTGEEEIDMKMSKSVCAGYVTELLMLAIHYSENVTMLENFSKELFDLSQQESTPKLHDLAHWISPARKIPSYTHDGIPYLTTVLKSHLEDAASLPPELITAVRILKHISLPPADETDELKYMYATIQLFANDGMSCFVTLLQSVCETFLKPSHQSVALVGMQGVLVVALIKPIVSMMKSILGYLISCRAAEFQDLTAVPVLLQVYSLMLMIPTSSFSFHLANAVQNDIVETLLSYTQPSLAPEETEESLSKSLWTQMVQQVLKYAQQSPRCFITGLSVLSELLPLPLPLQTREPLGTEEINRTINHRKLWSAHLHSLSGVIQEIIMCLAATSCQPLQQLLRRVCIQLADLATPTALIIVRAVMDAFLDAIEMEYKEANGSVVPPQTSILLHPVKPCSPSLSRILNLVAYLVSHAAFKIPFMHVLQANTKVDEKYVDVLQFLLNLLNFPSEKPSHAQSQECIVSVLQSLCDPDIGFITVESGASINEVLGSCLPSKEQMILICSALIHHVASYKHSYASILPALRSLVMLTEHDYGFFHIKQCLEQHPEDLRSLFSHLSSSSNKDSSDYFSTLSTALEFLRLMVNGYEEGAQTGRSMLLSPSELANIMSSLPSTNKGKQETEQDLKHSNFQALLNLEKFLTECTTDEEAVESLLDNLSGLILLLNEGTGKEEKLDNNKDIMEPVLPPWESLPSQFSSRTVFLVGEIEEERLNPAYWLSVSVTDDADQDQEQVPSDLMSIAEKYTSAEFDLKSTLESLCSSVDTVSELKKEKGLSTYNGKQKYQSAVNSGSTEGNIKRTFVAPMRGRGFSRATTHSTRANDPFRSRPPNTSRPPSMHVDDFVALESHHTGSNSQAEQKRQDGNRGRGRGFDRNQAFSSVRGGGRFFSPPGPYGRRDPNTRGEQCGSRGTTRISNSAWNSRANSSVPKSPTGPGVRTNFSSRPSVSERCSYNSPFVPLEPRLTSQRSRDPYSELSLPPGAVPISRFSRGVRVGGGLGTAVQGHWQETRNKAQNQRFMSSTSQARGSGRRDLNGRHARSFTR